MRRSLFLCLLVAGFTGSAVQAQGFDAFSANNMAYYRFAESSDITIEVKVWGAVANPGLYEVRQGLTLSSLLSLAGGPRVEPRTRRASSIFFVRLYRLQPEGRYQLLAETQMLNELRTLDRDPVLLHGDMLMTEERIRQRFGWRDGLSILTAIASVALVIDNVFFQ